MPIWQLAKAVAVDIYRLTSRGAFSKDFAIRDQVRRASLSISSNIAEGFECGTRKEFIRYLHIARASAGEVRSQLEIAKELDYITETQRKEIASQLESVARQITAFIQTLKKNELPSSQVFKSVIGHR